MPALRGIVVSVGEWYARTLSICLVRNMRHMVECVVVTAPGDPSIEIARAIPGVRLHITDDFYKHGAKFNKGLSLQTGFDVLGRHGWILVHDADVIFPDVIPFERLRPDRLHGARRRILDDPGKWHPALDWATCPLSRDGNSPIGFFQLFHADDPHLQNKPWWYDVTFAHAGGADAAFLTHWPRSHHAILPFEVLHLGPNDRHWFGTDDESIAMMARFVTENGWARAAAKFSREQVERAAPIVERVDVPGYPKSDFILPFVRRAQQAIRRP